MPIDLVAVASVDLTDFGGPHLDHGYEETDAISIALYSKSKG